jgi:hypothetical protein
MLGVPWSWAEPLNHCLVRLWIVGVFPSVESELEDLDDGCVTPFVAVPAAHWELEKKQPGYILAAKAACAKIELSTALAQNWHTWLQA